MNVETRTHVQKKQLDGAAAEARVLIWALGLGAALATTACGLNPQAEPPGADGCPTCETHNENPPSTSAGGSKGAGGGTGRNEDPSGQGGGALVVTPGESGGHDGSGHDPMDASAPIMVADGGVDGDSGQDGAELRDGGLEATTSDAPDAHGDSGR